MSVKRIWLQVHGDSDSINWDEPTDEVTWCEDKINDSDTEYILASDYNQLQEALEKYGQHWGACDSLIPLETKLVCDCGLQRALKGEVKK